MEELLNREKECRPTNEATLRGIPGKAFQHDKNTSTRTDPIRDLELRRLHLTNLLKETQRDIAELEQETRQAVEEEFPEIRRRDKNDIRLLNILDGDKRAIEADRPLLQHEKYQNMCDARDQLIAELLKVHIEIDTQRREFSRAIIEVL
jgi:hypothetical protein